MKFTTNRIIWIGFPIEAGEDRPRRVAHLPHHEFISTIIKDRHPAVNVWEAIAYTIPGIKVEQSALLGGECMKIKDYEKAPVYHGS